MNKVIGKKCIIYLADLVHNYAAKGPHTFPINIGYVASYAKKFYGDKIEVRLFKFPKDLIEAIEKKKPHIVGLGNYTWNLDINNRIISHVKSISQDILTVYGGPDYPVDCQDRLRYFEERPCLDFCVIDQGENGFVNLLKRYFESSGIAQMKKAFVKNCSFYDKSANEVVASKKYEYIENLDQIPSPYLSGILDEFFKFNLIPLIETNRGCPYSCTYCAWGKASQNRIFPFGLERVKQEIEYITKKIKKTDILYVADANFGILNRDIEIAEFLRVIRDKYGYPRHISASGAKATPNRMIKIAETLSDMISVTSSFQTMDPLVAKNIKRQNINIDAFKKIQGHFNKKGICTYSELILGLPGETKESHLAGLRELFDYGAAGISCYNLRMLSGSELDTPEERERFDIKTKHRLIDGGFGKYADIVSIEQEEMVLHTSTMTEEDILYFRPIHFLIQFLWSYKYYLELPHFLKCNGINPVDFIIALIDKKDTAPVSVRNIFKDFIEEMYNEWFDTKQKLFEYYSKPQNFKAIALGGFGKLNYRYTYRFLFEAKKDFGDYLFKTAGAMLAKHKTAAVFVESGEFEDLRRFSENIFIDFSRGLENLNADNVLEFKHDVLKWKHDGYNKQLSEYRNHGVKLKFTLPPDQAKTLRTLYEQFKCPDMNQTLRKMVEYMNKRDLLYETSYL
ncbi:MAG: radical SAM protein [Candidatus Omnitrophota bacterium]